MGWRVKEGYQHKRLNILDPNKLKHILKYIYRRRGDNKLGYDLINK